MNWRVAKSLLTLRDQINAMSPNRDKSWDGTIGDEAHASRTSDHNPWVEDPPGPNVVTALDITNDPNHGVVSQAIADALVASRDPRIKYVISNRRIANPDVENWAWRPYGGKNPHDHHVHISVKDEKVFYDLTALWKVGEQAPPEVVTRTPVIELPVLRKGAKDVATAGPVMHLQIMLNKFGAKLKVDADFGDKTLAAVKEFQQQRGLVVDGVVGGYTWAELAKLGEAAHTVAGVST